MSDRRLWLEEPCPTCGVRSGLRCQTGRYAGKPTRVLHAARGWRQRSCPTCRAQAGELCKTPAGRRASQPHSARLQRGRRELFAEEQVWGELERWEAAAAVVRFSGGGGHQGSIAAVALEDAHGRELARWSGGEGELPEALAAAIWGRYALFRGHPRISGLLMWDVRAREVLVAGERSGEKFEELLSAPRQPDRSPIMSVAGTARDTSRTSAPPAGRGPAPAGRPQASRSCERCGEPLRAGGARGSALLLQGLPPSSFASPAEGPAILAAGHPARSVRVVPGSDARGRARRGALLFQALPAGLLAPRNQTAPARARCSRPRPASGAPSCKRQLDTGPAGRRDRRGLHRYLAQTRADGRVSASKDAAERAVGTRGRQTTGDDQLRRREPRTVSYQASGGTWSPERVAAAMQDWSQLVGQPPRIPDWCPREHFEGPYLRQVWERHYPRWPEASTVKHHFGTWREGLIAAGLPVDRPPLTLGLQERIAAARSMRDQGLRQVEIAAELGAHPSAVGNYLRAHLCDCDQRYVVVGRRCSPCANQRAVAGRVDQGERAGGDSGAGASSKAGSRPASSGGRTATRVSAGGGSTPRGPPLTR